MPALAGLSGIKQQLSLVGERGGERLAQQPDVGQLGMGSASVLAIEKCLGLASGAGDSAESIGRGRGYSRRRRALRVARLFGLIGETLVPSRLFFALGA